MKIDYSISWGYIVSRMESLYGTTPDSEDTIEAKPVRHGRWIKENIVLTSLPPQRRWHCSVCGSIRDGYDESVLTPYCPNCGCKMDLDEVNDE